MHIHMCVLIVWRLRRRSQAAPDLSMHEALVATAFAKPQENTAFASGLVVLVFVYLFFWCVIVSLFCFVSVSYHSRDTERGGLRYLTGARTVRVACVCSSVTKVVVLSLLATGCSFGSAFPFARLDKIHIAYIAISSFDALFQPVNSFFVARTNQPNSTELFSPRLKQHIFSPVFLILFSCFTNVRALSLSRAPRSMQPARSKG